MQSSGGRHTAYLLTESGLKIYAEDEKSETHQTIHESEDMSAILMGTLNQKRDDVLTFVSKSIVCHRCKLSAPSHPMIATQLCMTTARRLYGEKRVFDCYSKNDGWDVKVSENRVNEADQLPFWLGDI